MDRLNADCLLIIFNYLTLRERIRLEAVCRRWFSIVRISFSNEKYLNVAACLNQLNKCCSEQQYNSDSFESIVVSLMAKSGMRIRTLSFGSRWFRISQPIIDAISDYCPNLTSLDLSCTIINANIIEALSFLAPQLTELLLDEISWTEPENGHKINGIFTKMTKIRKINIRRATFDLYGLPELPACLEYINLSGAGGLRLSTFHQFLINHQHLVELHASPLPCWDRATMDIIASLQQRLKTLTLGYIQRLDEILDISPLARLTNLHGLHIQSCLPLNARILTRFCSAMSQLRSVTIGNCQKLFDYSPLQQCPNLNSLSISQTALFCDQDLTQIARNNHVLHSLSINTCPNVTTEGIEQVLNCCPIQQLSISACDQVDDRTLVALANNSQLSLTTLSFHSCPLLTNRGLLALSQFANLANLKELDISFNLFIDDTGILHLYRMLQQSVAKLKSQEELSENECKLNAKRGRHESTIDALSRTNQLHNCAKTREMQLLTVYVHRTNVSKHLQTEVADYITLNY